MTGAVKRRSSLSNGTSAPKDNQLVLYGTQATVQDLGDFKGVNHLEFRLRDDSTSAAHATVAAVRSHLAHQPNGTAFSAVPSVRAPGDWPAKSVFDQRSKVLDILTVLAVISAAFLLANTIRTMIAEQTGEIGVMTATGASRRDVRRTYLRSAALLGVMGAVVGVPLSIVLAYVLVGLFGRMVVAVLWAGDPPKLPGRHCSPVPIEPSEEPAQDGTLHRGNDNDATCLCDPTETEAAKSAARGPSINPACHELTSL